MPRYCPQCVPRGHCYVCGLPDDNDHKALEGVWWHEDATMQANDPDFTCPSCGATNATTQPTSPQRSATS